MSAICGYLLVSILFFCATDISQRAWGQNVFSITATWSGQGEISTDGQPRESPALFTVAQGDTIVLLMFFAQGIHVDCVIVDGVLQPHEILQPSLSQMKENAIDNGPGFHFTFTNVTADHTIYVHFAEVYFTILATAGPNGKIDPAGTVSEGYNSLLALFTLTPNPGFKVDSLIVDGTPMTPQNQYRFDMIQSDHTIRATFTAASVLGVSNPEGKNPIAFRLAQNYPNPFNPQTSIAFSLPHDAFVNLVIYDILGQPMATLMNEKKVAGEYSVTWNTGGASTGVYFYRIVAGNFAEMRKMVVVR